MLIWVTCMSLTRGSSTPNKMEYLSIKRKLASNSGHRGCVCLFLRSGFFVWPELALSRDLSFSLLSCNVFYFSYLHTVQS